MQADWRDITIGQADGQDVKLSYDKRTQGIAVIGKTGTGKSNLIAVALEQEMQKRDCTIILFDPHGELARAAALIVAAWFMGGHETGVAFISPDSEEPIGINLLETDVRDFTAIERTVDVTLQIFKKLLGGEYTFMPRFEYIMGNAIRTLIYANTGYTLAEVPLILTNEQFRRNVQKSVTNPQIRQFWQEYETIAKREYERVQYIESAANRLNTLLANEVLYRIVSHSRSTIRFPELLESGKIIVVSLPMGKLGEGATSLLGSIMLAKCAEALYSRGTGKKRVHLYIDEYGRFFATPFTVDLLTQGRKYNVSTLVTMQSLQGLEETSKAAALNAGNTIAFQLVPKDAEELSGMFPVSIITQEASKPTYSLHAVDDLLQEGSPSHLVQVTSTVLLDVFNKMEQYPRRDFFEYPQEGIEWNRVWKNIPKIDLSWRNKFIDGYWYITSRHELMQTKEALDKYLYLWQTFNFKADEFPVLYTIIIINLLGYFGIYPRWRKAKRTTIASHIPRSLLEQNTGIPGEHDKWIIPINEDTFWEYTREFPTDLGDILPLAIGQAYYDAATEYKTPTVDQIPDAFKEIARQDYTKIYLAARKQTIEGHIGGNPEKNEPFVNARLEAEFLNLRYLARVLFMLGIGIAVDPLQIKSRFYPSQDNRTIADLKNEIASTLATLPLYTAMCQLRQDNNTNWAGIVKLIKG